MSFLKQQRLIDGRAPAVGKRQPAILSALVLIHLCMPIEQIEPAVRSQQTGNDFGPFKDIRQPVDRTPGNEDDIVGPVL
ncbi:hypothetical protein D3C84_1213250 [compost metagenome]